MKVYVRELVHEKSGEVVSVNLTLDPLIAVESGVPGYSWRASEMVPASDPTESRRLDWLMLHQSAELDKDGSGPYIVAYLTGGDTHANGIAGHFIGRGANHRECIDAFLRGQITRVD